ncbi:CDP-alcohol phosphatidyltransferase family protein [Nocardioides sp. SYSU D00038]|uniref:CDP-alcohol phosphatidyltransferase family protein n=1 Tax=Nocardioides sp. SYSU D00038 TaxID=2812554 RepID=UPI001967AC16|nr:CDP-alcohol phosphatidyltransferase family protein [Nocardioides sp. SYSU D00038]
MRLLGVQRPGPADVMTLANAACGAAAVLVVLHFAERSPATLDTDGIRTVTILLLIGTIFDTLDGRLARGGRGTRLGPMLDSLADALSFGLAPALLLAQLGLHTATGGERLAIGAGFIVYVGGALLRLADFSSGRLGDHRFTGLPSPLAAGLAVATGLLTSTPWIVAAVLAAVGVLMVSRLGYPKQRGPILAGAMVAWVFGIAGSLGVYDVRIGAVVILFVIGVVMPALPLLDLRHRAAA